VVGEGWIRMLGSIPYSCSLASSSPLGMTLHNHTARRPYPGADKRTQVPLISQRWTQKWWYGGTEIEHPAHPVGAEPRQFRNCGRDRLDPRDFCCAVSRQFGIMVMIASGPTTSALQ
jgi:hypothetical protein